MPVVSYAPRPISTAGSSLVIMVTDLWGLVRISKRSCHCNNDRTDVAMFLRGIATCIAII
jgi:hypothetical protein